MAQYKATSDPDEVIACPFDNTHMVRQSRMQYHLMKCSKGQGGAMCPERVLITGASGLLGRHLYQEFMADPSWETLGLAYSRSKGQLRKVDITSPEEVASIFAEFKPTVVIHSAAERRPDNVENKAEATRLLNVDATRTLCQEADNIGAVLVYISTDYVFDGTSPPYQVHDKPNPLNKYGQSKLDGEKVVTEMNADNIIFRVPILYGELESLDESAVTVLFPSVKETSKKAVMDNHQKLYPTYCADIAWVLRELVDKRLQVPSLTGIFHWSGDEQMTKYDMSVIMATAFNISTNHIEPFIPEEQPTSSVRRPHNAHLDPKRLEELGISKRTPFKEAVAKCLQPFV